jgi:RNA polymerase sigma factor (TIGR02999 family)
VIGDRQAHSGRDCPVTWRRRRTGPDRLIGPAEAGATVAGRLITGLPGRQAPGSGHDPNGGEARQVPQDADVTQALLALSAGDRAALDGLLPVIYGRLREQANRALRRERPDHTLSPTALVHEAYLKLVRLERVVWQDRAHFFGACANEMRRILVDHARQRRADKRGAGAEHVSLENALEAAQARPAELVALDEALERLRELDERQVRIVECRFFAGMSVEETAEALDISPATVKRDWTLARAWLNRELSG